MKTIYVSIGNSDDKLTQAEWSEFYSAADLAIRGVAVDVHGAWVSPSTDPWQNACWCVALHPEAPDGWLREELAKLAAAYRQDSIAWAEAPKTEFLCPAG